jgi:hypothetical protein
MSQKACSLEGGYLLCCHSKYPFQGRVKLVDLDYQTLIYELSSISSSVHGSTALTPTIGIGSLEWMDMSYD